jgi:hypothetical protein
VAVDELIVETLVISLAMMMLGVFLHGVVEVALTQRNHLSQAF